MILWGCRLPGSFSLFNDNSFQPNLDLWDFRSMNFSCLLQKSDRCALSWKILLLKAAGLTVYVRLWEMCDPLFIFMDIPVIPKTFDKDFLFFLGLYFAENFSVLMHFTSKLVSAALQPLNQQVLVLCPTEKDSRGPVGLELWFAGWSRARILNGLNNTLKVLLESMSTCMSNVGGHLFTDLCQCFSFWLDTTPTGLGQLVRSSGESCIRDSLAVLLRTLALLRAAQRFQWPGHFIWPGCFPVFPCDHH